MCISYVVVRYFVASNQPLHLLLRGSGSPDSFAVEDLLDGCAPNGMHPLRCSLSYWIASDNV